MRHAVAKLIPALLCTGGCSLLYNPSNIGKAIDASDGQRPDMEMTADADIDAPAIFDADPGMLTLIDVTPKVLYEGQGQFNSRKALVVIRGHHFISDGLTVDITPNNGLTLDPPMVSANGDYIALTVSVAIDTNANMGSTPLTITVNQNGGPSGGVSLADQLTLQNLPQFPSGTSIATSSLAPLYSEVNTGNVAFSGTQRAIVRSVSRIKMGNVSANGGAGTSNGVGGAGGPGACGGGSMGANAPCAQVDGGGGGAAGTSGGGGGGFGAVADTGVGDDGGIAGAMHGNVQLVSFGGGSGLANLGAGGGGGGKGLLSNAGGGGGGGGALELTAGGDIEVGTVDAKGGAGGAGSSVVMLGASGGGGGGSGGAIVVRSEAGTITSGAITATPGTGGAGGGTGAGAGGAGAPGRVRVDVASGSLPSSTPEPHRGPAFVGVPQIVTMKTLSFQMSGSNGDIVDAYVIPDDNMVHTGEPMDVMFNNGSLMLQGVLLPGYNKFCVTLEPGMRQHADKLADTCVELAYLP